MRREYRFAGSARDGAAGRGGMTESLARAPQAVDPKAAKERDCGAWRVVIRDIGSAGAAALHGLSSAVDLPRAEAVRRCLQAPSTLVDGLSAERARAVVGVLGEMGLNAAAEPAESGFEEGVGDREVALVINDFRRCRELLQAVIALTGQAPQQAIATLRQTPCVLLGQLSAASVAALRERFAACGASLDQSQSERARYDLLLQTESAAAAADFERFARTAGQLPLRSQAGGRHSLVATDLQPDAARELWREAGERRLDCQIVNQDFQRFDIRLQAAPAAQHAALAELLERECAIPASKFPRLVGHLPLVVARQRSRAHCLALLAALQALGVAAEAEMTASLRFDLQIRSLGDAAQRCRQLLVDLGALPAGCDDAGLRRRLPGGSGLLRGPFSYNQAHWLLAELKAAGASAALSKR